METPDILYYDGTSAVPSRVRVLVFNEQIRLYMDEDPLFRETFPVSACYSNHIGNNVFIYLESTGLQYLQTNVHHPIAILLENEQKDRRANWPQKLLRQRTSLLIVLMLAIVTGFYFLVVHLVPFIGMHLISVQQEIVMGEQLKAVMLQDDVAFRNNKPAAGNKQLQAFADKMKLSSTYPIRVTLVDDDMVNAFALPGGNIVVYKGILQKLTTADELAALLAHESTHINERHSLRSILRSTANAIIISIIFGDATGISGTIVSSAETLNGLQYSRSLETEADWKGMNLMLANNVDVKGMRALMQRLQEEENSGERLAFISTHPLTRERIRAADQFASKHSSFKGNRDDLRIIFRELKSALSSQK
jgi:Zn-dependent protease with chaperone function